jgi:hypothetical protein
MDEDEDDFYSDDDFCDCEEFDADILEGRAHCFRCGRSWWLSDEQMKQEVRFHVEMMQCIEEEAATPSPTTNCGGAE